MSIARWILGAVLVGTAALLILNARRYSRRKAIHKQIGKHDVAGAVLLVDDPRHGISETICAGNVSGTDQPFHIASVGKTLTAAVIGTLIDTGALRLDDLISKHLDGELLSGLFVYQGKDYGEEVTVRHLLSHTSGIADYFEDNTRGSAPMRELALTDKDKPWKPKELVAFTRERQSAVARPGEIFHYSDTGFILLGLLIEQVSGKSFDAMLHEKIFEPLHMDDSYLLFHSEPKNEKRPITDVWLKGVNLKDQNSLSIDWAGGGVVSTANDLAVFIRALYQGKIVKEETLRAFSRFDRKYMTGIGYGCGLTEYRFGEFSILLKSLPRYVGHMGILGTQMLCDGQTGGVLIAGFGSAAAAPASVRTMIKVLDIVSKTDKET